MECPWCAMELESGARVCPYCKNPVSLGSPGRRSVFKVLAVLALAGFIVLMLGDALSALLSRLLR